MKMEKTAREILVTLTASDQEAFGIRYDTMCFSDPRTRRFCEYMAVLVCLREGMRGSENLSVRAVENAAGELLLYFSCSAGEEEQRRCAVLEFFDVNGLLDCRSAVPSDPDLYAEVYCYGEKYYLWYSCGMKSDLFESLTEALSEFGRLTGVDRTFLCEHGIPLPGAVAYLLN